MGKQSNPINPVHQSYQMTLAQATGRMHQGKKSPLAALLGVQMQVPAKEQQLNGQYGTWNR